MKLKDASILSVNEIVKYIRSTTEHIEKRAIKLKSRESINEIIYDLELIQNEIDSLNGHFIATRIRNRLNEAYLQKGQEHGEH